MNSVKLETRQTPKFKIESVGFTLSDYYTLNKGGESYSIGL